MNVAAITQCRPFLAGFATALLEDGYDIGDVEECARASGRRDDDDVSARDAPRGAGGEEPVDRL